jgi:NAD(P)-dependent dehydrogenase (short-subunit alcohol dehydrogenase family)
MTPAGERGHRPDVATGGLVTVRRSPEVTEPEQRWPTALLTGATHGIGEATARILCPLVDVLLVHGPESEPQVAAALDELRSRNPATDVFYLSSDYGQLSEVQDLISTIRGRVDELHLVINNAGRPGPSKRTVSADGHEITFQTNYLVLVALTTGLLDVLEKSGRARVINVASATHYSAALDLDDLEMRHRYSGPSAYAHSKLAIVAYTCWLARQLESSPVEAASIHPGVISTALLHAMFGPGGDSVERGALNILSLVRRAPGVNGLYFDEDRPARPNLEALDMSKQERLMDATGRALREAKLFEPR